MKKSRVFSTTLFFCFVIAFLLCVIVYEKNIVQLPTHLSTGEKPTPVVIQNTIQQNNNDTRIDEMYDPYVPPYRDDSYVYRVAPVPTVYVGPVIEYRQIGLLTPTRGPTEDRLLPLMGRPLYRSGTKWQYYTMSNGHTPLKLPIHVRGKVATNDYGVDELDTGDHVHVEGHKEPFEVRSY